MGSVGVDVSLFESRALGNPFGVLKDSVVESSAGAEIPRDERWCRNFDVEVTLVKELGRPRHSTFIQFNPP